MFSPCPRVSTPQGLQPSAWRVCGLLLMGLLGMLAPFAGGTLPAAAQTCDRSGCGWIACGTPARPVPSTYWNSSLQPADASIPPERDVTGFNEFNAQYSANPYFFSVDIANGWAFTAMDYGVKVWDIHTSPTPTSSTSYIGVGTSTLQFLNPGDPNENKTPIQDVSVPAGNDTIAAVVGQGKVGTAIIDYTSKAHPIAIYQSYNVEATAVYAAQEPPGTGANYAFVGSTQLPGGLLVYNMDAARRTPGCSEGTPGGNCPGVYVGKIGTRDPAYVAGVGQFLVASSGAAVGFDLWDVTNPASPVLKLSGLTDRGVYGVAMWNNSGVYYVGALSGPNFANPSAPFQLQIFNVSCATTSCSGLPAPVSSTVINETSATTQSYFVTFSRSNASSFIYLGSDQVCGVPTTQREFLFDVSNPAAPHDITPPAVGGAGYWGWYYRANSTGFNYIMPRKGKFNGNYFYRAAETLFDIHVHAGQSVPSADFTWSPNPAYLGSPVQFQDLTLGQPTSWSWSFQNGSPSTAPTENPSVTFSQLGGQSVTLIAANSLGSSTPVTHTVNVINPAPAIGSVTVSPSSPLQCQPVTLTANNVTGKPPLTFAWNITNSNNAAATGGTSAANPFVWDTKANAVVPGTYTASLQVSGTGTPAPGQVTFSLAPLPSLPVSFAPTNDAFTASTVQFHVVASGATEWNWNFGDNAGGGPLGDGYTGWTNDPTNGPNPLHTYSLAGGYTVTVKVRNCTTDPNGLVSSSLPVTIVVALIADFNAVCSFAPCAFATNSPISFVDSSSGAAVWDYAWDFTGTGSPNFNDTGHTAPVTSHTYTVAGNYSPALRVHGAAGGVATFTSPSITVATGAPPPPAIITVSGPTTGAVNTPYTFSAFAQNCTPSATWTWTFTGGTASPGTTTGSSITVTYATASTYSVVASNVGCSGAIGSAGIVIGSGNPGGGNLQAVFSFSPSAPSVGAAVTFDGSQSTGNPTSYVWDFGDGTKGSGAVATHAYNATGPFTVKLDVVAPGTGPLCLFGTCDSEVVKTVTVGGTPPPPPPPPLSSDFTSSAGAGCSNVGGFWLCPATTGQPSTLTGLATTPGTNFAWNFGDGTTGSGSPVTHSWSPKGSYSVTLTVSATGFTGSSTTKTFQVVDPPLPATQSVVLPWVASTRGALVQSCDLYLHNPSTSSVPVTLQFRKRGAVDVNPPVATVTIEPGATMYAPDVVQSVFNQDNIAGFVMATVDTANPLPVMTSFNTVVRSDGSQFGQTVPGLALPASIPSNSSGPAPSTFQYLIGMDENTTNQAYFGITNPTATTTTYHVQLFDTKGNLLGGSSGDLVLGAFSQRQFQTSDVQNLFGLSNATDYLVSIENKSGSNLFPYGENLRLGSGDPSFVVAGTTGAATQYVVGAFSTNGSWQTDVVLANPSSEAVTASLTFTGLGVAGKVTAPVQVTLAAGDTQRLTNAIAGQWNLSNAVGVITITASSASGPFPIVRAETYNNAKTTTVYGQSMPAFAPTDAAEVGQVDYLVGLRQDAAHLTTLWVFNNSTDAGVYDLVYRGLDGTVLGTLSGVGIPPGKLRQFLPNQHPLPAAGAKNGFTVQVVVHNGSVLTGAQVLTLSTGDPAYVTGVAR
jgi:PKD repeat protein